MFYAALLIITMVGAYFMLINSGFANLFADLDLLVMRIRELGILGPMLVIGLMTLAIVFNPLPSAPIALAAGSVYGHIYGTIYIVAGAEIGAIIAFLIARLVGYEVVRKYLGGKWSLDRFGTQNALTAVIFVSRLIPFLSFDLVSYAAGLSPILFWRFALATLFGLIPVSFMLAHFGGEIVHADAQSMMIIFVALVLVTALPILLSALRSPAHKKDNGNPGAQH